jgi:2-dehydro-3-deoxygluconokinase
LKFDIAAIGEPLFELNQQPDGRFLPGFGGDTSNVAIAAARLRARTAYITKLGADVPGNALLELWQREGVDTRAVSRIETAPTGLYLVTHSAQGHAFTYYRKDSAASRLTPADVPQEIVKNAKFLHVSAISQAISSSARECVSLAIDVAAKSGVAVSYDTNLRLKLWDIDEARAVIDATARQAAILKTSQDDAIRLTGESEPLLIARYYHNLGSIAVIVTLGPLGVFVSTRGSEILVPGFKVVAVDATGAGDAFTGALLAELCREQSLAQAARFANAAAALSTRGYGAVAPLPKRQEVEVFLTDPIG